MKIVVLDGYTLNPGDNSWDGVESLGSLIVHDRTSEAEIVSHASVADVLLTNKTPLTRKTIEQLPNSKFVSVLATGFNVVDTIAACERGIPVSNVPVYGTDTVAQHVFAVLLHLIHHPGEHDAAVRTGEWQKRQDFSFWLSPLTELAGKTMGIVGFGRIGRKTAEIAHAFGMYVIAHDVSQGNPPNYDRFAWSSIDELFKQSDVVSLHCPQTADNKQFVNAKLISKMKPTAILINAARGTLINESELATALNAGAIAGACLDVVSVEPISADNPLLNAINCLITPHMAWATVEARRRLMQTTAENIAAFQSGKPINVVN